MRAGTFQRKKKQIKENNTVVERKSFNFRAARTRGRVPFIAELSKTEEELRGRRNDATLAYIADAACVCMPVFVSNTCVSAHLREHVCIFASRPSDSRSMTRVVLTLNAFEHNGRGVGACE